jgi:hypothetical protein
MQGARRCQGDLFGQLKLRPTLSSFGVIERGVGRPGFGGAPGSASVAAAVLIVCGVGAAFIVKDLGRRARRPEA